MKIKALEWSKSDLDYAQSPAHRSGVLSICFEDDKYWANWDVSLPAFPTLDAAKAAAQSFHNAYIATWLEE